MLALATAKPAVDAAAGLPGLDVDVPMTPEMLASTSVVDEWHDSSPAPLAGPSAHATGRNNYLQPDRASGVPHGAGAAHNEAQEAAEAVAAIINALPYVPLISSYLPQVLTRVRPAMLCCRCIAIASVVPLSVSREAAAANRVTPQQALQRAKMAALARAPMLVYVPLHHASAVGAWA